MEWFGIVALLLMLCYSAYPGKVKRLETKVKRLEKKQRGVAYMSKLINDLVGKETDLSFHSQFHYVCQHCLSTAVNSTMVKLIVKLADRFF